MCAMVGALVSDRELADVITLVSRQLGQEVICIETSPEGLVGALRMLEPHGVRAILSAGRLAELLKTATTLPVISCNPDSFDLLLAFNRARLLFSKVALLHFGGLSLDIREIEEALQITIGEFECGRSTQEVRFAVEQIKSAGFEVVVSGQVPASIARNHGLSAVVVRAGTVSVKEALRSALDALSEKEAEDTRLLAAQTAAESAGFGVVVADRNGKIQFMNAQAREITAVATAEHINDVLGKGAWDRFSTATSNTFAVFGEERLIAECRFSPTLPESRVITIADQPYLRRLLANVADDISESGAVASFSDMVAVSLSMGSLIARALDLARKDQSAVIYGERGSGRHTVAQAIHTAGRRCRAPFVRLNAFLPAESVLADLIGSAAMPDEPTLLERAHGGTLYVHECLNLSLEAQRVLVEAIERKSVRRYDGTRAPCDVRVLLGSKDPMRDAVDERKMLPDLYERCAGDVLRIPALRERQEDILPMLTEFLSEAGLSDTSLSGSLLRKLQAHSWNGNCAELRNFASRLAAIYRAFPSASRSTVEKTAFDELESEARVDSTPSDDVLVLKLGTMEFLEEQILEQMDRIVGGNKSELARRLGISRTTLWKKQKSDEEQSATE